MNVRVPGADLKTAFLDHHGLICGYCVDADGTMETVGWADMDAALTVDDALVWLHFDQVDSRARHWIGSCERIPESAKAVLLGSDRHMRIEASGQGLCGVVGDLHHEFSQTSEPTKGPRL